MSGDPQMHPRLDFLLKYSSDVCRDSYRDASSVDIPRSSLSYDVVPAGKKSGKGSNSEQTRFRDKVVFVPTTKLKGNYRSRAIIDRMIIVIKTDKVTSWSGIRSSTKRAGLRCFVDDMSVGQRNIDFDAGIRIPPEMQSGLTVGRVFAVLIQEPRPKQLKDMLDAIRNDFGIHGIARIFLLELSLDFYPAKSHGLVDRVGLREQMVGLLQRHHHVSSAGYLDAMSDARQIYNVPNRGSINQSGIDFLFSSPKKAKRVRPDFAVEYPEVRNRLHHGRVGNQLFLDATLYKGSQLDGLLYRMQHKVTDRRDGDKKTVQILPEPKRRARLEAEISGYARLEELGLQKPEDVFGFDFRKIRARYLQFWLPTASEDWGKQVVMRNEFEGRGLYGTEIIKRLSDYEAKGTNAPLRKNPQNASGFCRGKGKTEERVAWVDLNNRVGDALDGLNERWGQTKAPF